MRFSTVALATLFALSADVSHGAGSNSKYTYNPEGETYNGKTLPGPGQWPGVCNDPTATRQTPIEINASFVDTRSDVVVGDYTFSPGNCKFDQLKYGVEDNGVKVTFDASVCTPPTVKIPKNPGVSVLGLPVLGSNVFGPEANKQYTALQFHIHSKSEHKIDGTQYEAELHIVHAQDPSVISTIGGDLDGLAPGIGSLLTGLDGSRPASVVGFMISSTAPSDNMLFENLLKGWETLGCGVTSGTVDGSIVTTASFSPYSFLASDSCIFNYDGGLTTPNCDEIVEWNLAKTPISISSAQMTRLLALINDCPESVSFNGSTARPIQELNGRKVSEICPATRRARNLRNQEEQA